MAKGVNALEEWTDKESVMIFSDNTIDEFTVDGLFEKVKDKPNIALIATTTDGDVFGGFYSMAVTEQEKELYDLNMFIFSFESHGLCKTPQRFTLKSDKDGAHVKLFKNDRNGQLADFDDGAGWFYHGNEKSGTFCLNCPRTLSALRTPH